MQYQQQILDDIFGKCQGDPMFEGLVDSVDVSAFDRKLEKRWSKLDADRGKEFYEWFIRSEY